MKNSYCATAYSRVILIILTRLNSVIINKYTNSVVFALIAKLIIYTVFLIITGECCFYTGKSASVVAKTFKPFMGGIGEGNAVQDHILALKRIRMRCTKTADRYYCRLLTATLSYGLREIMI